MTSIEPRSGLPLIIFQGRSFGSHPECPYLRYRTLLSPSFMGEIKESGDSSTAICDTTQKDWTASC